MTGLLGDKKPKTVTHFTHTKIVTHFITYAEAMHSLGFFQGTQLLHFPHSKLITFPKSHYLHLPNKQTFNKLTCKPCYSENFLLLLISILPRINSNWLTFLLAVKFLLLFITSLICLNGLANTSEVTSIFVDNQKFVLSIRITKVTITIIVDMYKSIKVLFQIYMVTIKRSVTF